MTFTKQNGTMVNQTGNAHISGTTNDSVENSTQNIVVSTTERFINVPLNDCASDRQLKIATWHVSFALTMAPRAHVVCLIIVREISTCVGPTSEMKDWEISIWNRKVRSLLLDIITVWRSDECYARYRVAVPNATYSLVRHVMNA